MAIPESTDLGQVFKDFGVTHVVTFEFTDNVNDQGEEIESLLMPFRYNYIYTLCVGFYTALVAECTVEEAF